MQVHPHRHTAKSARGTVMAVPGLDDRPRWLWFLLRVGLLLAILVTPAMAARSQESEALLAVGDNSIRLTGFGPPSPPGGIDLSGYVEIPYAAALNTSGGQITIEAWVKRNETDRSETLVGNGWTTSYWFGFTDTGKLRFTPYGGGGLVDSNSSVPAGVWTHVAVTYDGVNRRFYINGVLDKATTDKPGALVGSSVGQPLGIGRDRDSFTVNYFAGDIDNVRIWGIARNGSDIQATMFHTFGAPMPSLRAEWSFDGNLQDSAGGHHGVAKNNVQFSNDGAIPHDIRISQVGVTPTLNGMCSGAEYASATQVTVDGTAVWLMHTADDLWICFDGLGNANKSATIYLDPDYTRLDPAQVEHLSLTVDDANVKTAREGQGDGTHANTTAADGLWDAAYTNCCGEFPTRRAEFRIDADLVNGWSHVIGIALAKSTGLRGGTDIWPALAVSNLPSTWSSAILSGIGPQRTFSGKVVYQPPDPNAPTTGVAGVVVKLIGRDPGGSEAMTALAESSPNGNFSLTTNDDFAEHRLELGAPPKGYRVEMAQAGSPPGVVADPRTIDYGAAGGGSYPNNVFTLGDVTPGIFDATNGPYFLIIAPQAVIDDGALDEFVAFKRRIGFTVAVTSVEEIDATTAGANRRDRIRNYEKGIWDAIGLRFQYVLLIGTNDEIPYAYFTEWFTGYISDGDDNSIKDLTGCLADPMANDNVNAKKVKLKRSEWYYADLVSNFDTNGNGCLLDGTKSDAADRASGYTPDTRPNFSAVVAVGRIPLANPMAVRTALQNSMRFEQQSEAFKQRTVLALSQVFLKGQYWTPKDATVGSYKPCPLDEADEDDTKVDKNCQGATTDAAYLGERMKADFLNALGYQSTIFYEAAKPEGASPVQSPKPLTIANVKEELGQRAHGFVNFAGHGGTGGVARTYWTNQNGNNMVDSPTEPLPFSSVDEASGAELFYKDSFNTLTPRKGRAPVYLAAACSTLSPINTDNIGAFALSQGHGVAWFGALNMVVVGPWTQPKGANVLDVNYSIAQHLFGDHMRLGDALWLTSDALSAKNGSGSADVSFALYGDPTLSYWGNPGGQTTLAAWPMLRYDARGIGYTTLAGPEVPKKLWEYSGSSSPSAHRSPVLSNNGEVVVAHGSFVDVLRQGQLHQRLNLDGPAFGSPAIAADGTIYAMDTSGRLYAFPYQQYLLHPMLFTLQIDAAQEDTRAEAVGALGERYRRWRVELGGAARTSPIVGADGMIAVGVGSKVMVVRPDGFKLKERNVPGQAILALAADAERNLYVTTTDGYAARINFFFPNCPGGVCVWDHEGAPYSTPPLLAYNALYIGRANGSVVKFAKGTMQVIETFTADSAITSGPIAGPAGQVLVGTQNGTLYSLTQDLGLRWQRHLGTPIVGMPAFSSDALYVVADNSLRAYSPFSGAPLWTRALGSGAGSGSVAVGYGRELIMQMTGGKIFSYGEGWSNQVIAVSSEPAALDNRPLGVKIWWYTLVPPIGGASESLPEATGDVLIQRRSGDGPWLDLVVLSAGTTEFVDTSAQPGVMYAYRVQVLDPDGNHSDFVETLVDVQSAPPVPQPPTWENLAATGAHTLALKWSSSLGDLVTAYRIERGESAGGPFAPVAFTSGDADALIDGGLDAGKTYFYRILALNPTGESNPSPVQSATTRSDDLPAPEDVLATELEDGRIRVTWASPEGFPSENAQAELQVSQGLQDGYIALDTVDAANAAYTFFPAEEDVYVIRVKFVKDNAESPWTESTTVTFGGEAGSPPDLTQQLFLPVVAND